MGRKINPGGPSRLYSSWLKGNLVIAGGDCGPATEYFVAKTGHARNDGLSWERPKLLIQDALDLCSGRGLHRVYVGPGGYAEDLSTPTDATFGQLIAYNPTGRSTGAVYLTSATATTPILTISERGWLIDGFEFDAPTTDGCIMLSGAGGKFTEIANCLFVGSTYATGFGVDTTNANPLVIIRDSYFYQFTGTSGVAITSTNVYCLQWEIARCVFWNNKNHIAPKNSKGFQASVIHDCVFHKYMAALETTIKIDMRGGSGNVIYNNFLGSTYDNTGGYYASGTDEWRGNATEDHPSHTAQGNPA